ncbi:MAG TPA: BatD family protein, partial [Gillisia sp.]|nr:BatD family protein [Gillisia sp.]
NGNLKLFDLPQLEVPATVEKYEPERDENVRTDLNGTQGSLTDNYTLVPTRQGEFSIPALSFSYLDVRSLSYRTITSSDIRLEVDRAPAGGNPVAGNMGYSKQPVEVLGDQFRYIKLSTNLHPIGSGAFLGSITFWSLLTLPFAFLIGALLLGRKREAMINDVKGNRIKKANRLTRKYLSEARKNLGDHEKFYIALERALHNYLKAKLHIQTSDMSKERIKSLLQDRNVDEQTSAEFNSLLASCEYARYTPSSKATMQQDYDKAASVISAIDKQIQ